MVGWTRRSISGLCAVRKPPLAESDPEGTRTPLHAEAKRAQREVQHVERRRQADEAALRQRGEEGDAGHVADPLPGAEQLRGGRARSPRTERVGQRWKEARPTGYRAGREPPRQRRV